MSSTPSIRMIVGLGNPGRQYERTRHNLGFLAVDRLAEALGVEFKRELKWNALVARKDQALIMKPQTFMNESGRSVGKLADFLKLEAQEILVVYDDVALPLGTLKFKMKGSAAGHNGLKSLIAHLGTDRFPRLKLGIDEAAGAGLVGHVLGKFREEEWPEVEKILATAVEALQVALPQGVEAAANQFN